MHHWTRSLGVLLAVTTLGLGMGSAVQARSSHASMTPVTLQLKWVPQAQFAGYFVALDKGYYKQAGLDVTIKPGGPDIAPEQVIASGGANFGIDWLSALLVARDKGLPLTNIAQIFQASGMRLISFKSKKITSISQFKGHKVGVWFSGNEYQFEALMSKENMTPPTKYMSVVSQPFVMTPFLNHTLDVAHAMTYNELGVVYEAGVKPSQLNIFDYNTLGVRVLEDGIFANNSWLKSHKDVAVKFLRASIMGWKYAVQHPDEAGQISFNHAPKGTSTLAHQKYMSHEVAKLIMYGPGMKHPIGYMDPDAFQQSAKILLNEKVVKKSVGPAAYDQTYYKLATAGM